jgi:hypothetical protein
LSVLWFLLGESLRRRGGLSLLATGRFVSADSRSVLRYNGAASSVIYSPVNQGR